MNVLRATALTVKAVLHQQEQAAADDPERLAAIQALHADLAQVALNHAEILGGDMDGIVHTDGGGTNKH